MLDADGLNAHAGRLEELQARSAPTVLTPHAGELGRLLELDSAEIDRERLRHVRKAAERAAAVVVLKGDDSLIAHPDGRVAVSPGGSPALATAGTGDVLTGVIAALLAQRPRRLHRGCRRRLPARRGRPPSGRQGGGAGGRDRLRCDRGASRFARYPARRSAAGWLRRPRAPRL